MKINTKGRRVLIDAADGDGATDNEGSISNGDSNEKNKATLSLANRVTAALTGNVYEVEMEDNVLLSAEGNPNKSNVGINEEEGISASGNAIQCHSERIQNWQRWRHQL